MTKGVSNPIHRDSFRLGSKIDSHVAERVAIMFATSEQKPIEKPHAGEI